MIEIVLLFYLIILLLAQLYKYGNEIFHPAMIFTAGFTVSLLYFILWSPILKSELSPKTAIVIGVGVTVFVIFSNMVKSHHTINDSWIYDDKRMSYFSEFKTLSRPMAYIWAAFSAIVFFLVFVKERELVSVAYNVRGFRDVIHSYDSLNKFSTYNVTIPYYLKIPWELCGIGGQVWLYVLINEFYETRKIPICIVLNVAFSFALELLGGGRGGIMRLILGVLFFIFIRKLVNEEGIDFRFISRIGLSVFAIGATWGPVGKFLVGRVSISGEKSAAYNLLSYLGGPIHNFDVFIRHTNEFSLNSMGLFGATTFYPVYNSMGHRLGISTFVYRAPLEFQLVNGYETGNTYTAFYPLINDFSFLGCMIAIAVMGLVSGMIYQNSKHSILLTILYSFIYYYIAFSGFTEGFYRFFVSFQFIRILISFEFLLLLLSRLDIKVGGYS